MDAVTGLKFKGPASCGEGLSLTGGAVSTHFPFWLPTGCSLGVARACPVLGLRLVVVRG